MPPPSPKSAKTSHPVRRFFAQLGPGFVTGAADDDPSGIATYSIAGAQWGVTLLWTALITWPLMGCVQFMCARIGLVTGEGLAGALKKKFPRPLVIIAALALLIANTINIGADLSAMAEGAWQLTGWSSHLFVIVFGLAISWAAIQFRYEQIANILKWLALTLFAYVITAFLTHPDWSAVLTATVRPSWPSTHEAWATLVAILGTTISPYLFFWQASQEVEEEKAQGKRRRVQRQGATPQEIGVRKMDVAVGAFFSNLVMYFIILTTAMTLHRHGVVKIETTRQAADALRPLAGPAATLLYTAGLIGIGLLAIPTLSGSAAYAFAEIFHWRQGLNRKLEKAPAFYGVMTLSTLLGIGLEYIGIHPVQALFWSAVINGLLAPFLLAGILLVASDPAIMNGQPSSRLSRIVVGVATLAMFGAAIGLFAF